MQPLPMLLSVPVNSLLKCMYLTNTSSLLGFRVMLTLLMVFATQHYFPPLVPYCGTNQHELCLSYYGNCLTHMLARSYSCNDTLCQLLLSRFIVGRHNMVSSVTCLLFDNHMPVKLLLVHKYVACNASVCIVICAQATYDSCSHFARITHILLLFDQGSCYMLLSLSVYTSATLVHVMYTMYLICIYIYMYRLK